MKYKQIAPSQKEKRNPSGFSSLFSIDHMDEGPLIVRSANNQCLRATASLSYPSA